MMFLGSIALLLCTAGTARAEEKVPGLDEAQGPTHDVQLIGWSKDEGRYALRVYDVPLEDFAREKDPPLCKGYLDHTGKPFRGGLSLVLYEGNQRTGGWRIQDAQKCTPPDTARERLDQAKAALAEQGIDLSLLGATVIVPEEAIRWDEPRQQGDTQVFDFTTSVVLPHGPWAGSTFEVPCRTRKREKKAGGYVSRATLELRVRSKRRSTTLHQFQLGPVHWFSEMAGYWAMGFDRLFLSPTGTRLVAFAIAKHGNMRGRSASWLHIGFLDLAQHLGDPPKGIVPAR